MESWASGIPLQVLPPSLLLYTNALMTDLSVHLQDLMVAGVWPQEEKQLHIILEKKVVYLTLNAFLPTIIEVSHAHE